MIFRLFAASVLTPYFLTSCASILPKDEDRHDPPYQASLFVQQRAAYDFNCPKDQKPLIRSVSYLSYSARGCGRKAIYNCVDKSAWYEFAHYECKLSTNIDDAKQ